MRFMLDFSLTQIVVSVRNIKVSIHSEWIRMRCIEYFESFLIGPYLIRPSESSSFQIALVVAKQ